MLATNSKSVLTAAALAIAVVFSLPAGAGEIALTWDPVQGASGYRVYYGTASGTYGGTPKTVSGTSTTVTGLQDCRSYFLAVKAYNSAGESAQFSNEVSGWARPTLTSVTPNALMQGDQLTLDIYGSNFQSGVDVQFLPDPSDLRIDATSIATVACNHIQVLARVEPTTAGSRPAPVGAVELTVVNPDSVFGSQSSIFQITINPSRFDVNKSDDITRNRIDGKDTVWLARNFGYTYPSALYLPDYDFDGDGKVDGSDLAYLASKYGTCWTGAAWSLSACPVSLRQ